MNDLTGNADPELEQLSSQLCDGSLAAEELARLEQLVLSDAALRRQYIERVNLHAALGWNRAKAEGEPESAPEADGTGG